MAKRIKETRPSTADADVMHALHQTRTAPGTHYTKTGHIDWIEGHAMLVRIDLKFHLLHERMLVCGA